MRRAMSHEGSAEVRSPVGAVLRTTRFSVRPAAVVLVLHGGSHTSTAGIRWVSPAVSRMFPICWAVGRRLPGTTVLLLRHAVAGWNGATASPLADLDWALDRVRAEHPDTPVVLLGHSMGGRSAVHRVGAPGVAGAVLLTPWLPADDPVDGVAGRPLVVVQAAWDPTIPTPDTEEWLRRAGAAGALIDREILAGTEHTMLLRFPTWHRLAVAGVRAVLTLRSQPAG